MYLLDIVCNTTRTRGPFFGGQKDRLLLHLPGVTHTAPIKTAKNAGFLSFTATCTAQKPFYGT